MLKRLFQRKSSAKSVCGRDSVDLSAKPIIDGALSVEKEHKFYQAVEMKIVEVIAREHDFNLDTLLTAPELHRMVGILETTDFTRYSELANANSKLMLASKMSLITKIQRIVDRIDPINQGVNIKVLLGDNQD